MEKCLIERRDGEACNREGGWRSVLKKCLIERGGMQKYLIERGEMEKLVIERDYGEVFNREEGWRSL